MKKIICYGDSNTFGYDPISNERHIEGIYWTSILQANLGREYNVINEGVCDRTGFVDNPKGFIFSGNRHFVKFIGEVSNFEILILWLGTNDLQFKFALSLEVIEKGLRNLIKLSKEKAKDIILIPPVLLDKRVLTGTFSYQFDESSIEKSKAVQDIYSKIAEEENLIYFDVNKVVQASDVDGLHYDGNGHKVISDNLVKHVM